MKNLFVLILVGVFASTLICTAVRASVAGPLPEVFRSALAEVKAKTNVPVLLPTQLPKRFSKAQHASVDEAAADEYVVSLYYELDAGDSGFAASFQGTNNPNYSPRELGNVREVRLASGVTGFFRPVSCGGSCAPANLWWKEGSVVYQIQLKLHSTLREKDQQGIITAVANSAIVAGAR
jgi:hypothetical protein